MEEALYILQSVVEAEQYNCGPQQNPPLVEYEKQTRRSNKEHGMDQFIKRKKGVEGHPIAICVEARAEECLEKSPEKGVILTGKKFHNPPLPSTHKSIELSEDLNDVMKWFFRYYIRSLKQVKEPLQPTDNVVAFDVWTNTKELENIIKLNGCPSNL